MALAEALILVAVAVGFFLLGSAIRDGIQRRSTELPESSEIKNTVPGAGTLGSGGGRVTETVAGGGSHGGSIPPIRTLDEMYAAANDMWVCAHCETLNGNAASRCGACGAER